MRQEAIFQTIILFWPWSQLRLTALFTADSWKFLEKLFSCIFLLSWSMKFNHINFHWSATYYNDSILIKVSLKVYLNFHKSMKIYFRKIQTDLSYLTMSSKRVWEKKKTFNTSTTNIFIICCGISISTSRILSFHDRRDKKCIDMKIHLPLSYIWIF